MTYLLSGGSYPRYSPTAHIVYGAGGVLWAVPFDLGRLEVTGDPVPVLEGVQALGEGATNFSLATDGSLVYISGGSVIVSPRSLVWVDRQGREEPLALPLAAYAWPRLSPDGTRVAVHIVAPGGADVWTSELARGTLTRVTTNPLRDSSPVWTPDGERVVFRSDREGGRTGLFSKRADGSGPVEDLMITETGLVNPNPYDWSPDGATVVFSYQTAEGETGTDVGVLTTGEETWRPLLETGAFERHPAISPDGAWIAYTSDLTGQEEIYVERFPGLGDWQQISTGSGREPVWSRDGRELFYLSRNDALMMVVPIDTEPTLRAGTAEVLFDWSYQWSGGSSLNYDVRPDGQRFLVAKDDASEAASIVVVQNWFEELKRLVPVD